MIRFSKTYPSFLTVKEGSTFLTKPLFPQGREDVAGYAIASARVLASAAEPVPARGLPIIIYATKLRLCVGWRIESITGNSTLIRFYYCSLGEGCKMHSILFFSPLFLFLIAVSLCACRHSNEDVIL